MYAYLHVKACSCIAANWTESLTYQHHEQMECQEDADPGKLVEGMLKNERGMKIKEIRIEGISDGQTPLLLVDT